MPPTGVATPPAHENKARRHFDLRAFSVRLHRWAGLAMALFLVLAGLTGSLLAFNAEIDRWLNPDLLRARAAGPALSPDALLGRLAEQDPKVAVNYLPFRADPGGTIDARVFARTDPATAKPYAIDYDEVFLDPASGEVLGHRKYGACCFGPRHLMPFLYIFHYSLAAGQLGELFMGGVAILWFLDCFLALYLTWPRVRPYLAKWRKAWGVKPGAGAYRLNLDLHRAGGLWLWIVLPAIAMSGVSLTLNAPVFRPLVSLFATLSPSPFDAARDRPAPKPERQRLPYDRAVAIAAETGKAQGWQPPPAAIFDLPSLGVYAVYFYESSASRFKGLGSPSLFLDDSSGTVLRMVGPDKGTTGDIFLGLQFGLHSGRILGFGGRILISISGLATVMLAVTGTVIWWKKRQARLKSRVGHKRKAASRGSAGQPSVEPITGERR